MRARGNPYHGVVQMLGIKAPVYVNPDRREMFLMLRHPSAHCGEDILCLRGLIIDDDLYLWPGEVLHSQAVGCLGRSLNEVRDYIELYYLLPNASWMLKFAYDASLEHFESLLRGEKVKYLREHYE